MKKKIFYLLTIASALAFGFASIGAIAKSENGNENGEKSNSAFQIENKIKRKAVGFKKFQEPNPDKGETHSQLHKEKTTEVLESLEQVAIQEETKGNTEISNQIKEAAREQETTQRETVDAIEKVESRNKIKTFLIGSDYKNLGQLRSSLVQNRNQIRKLTQTTAQIQNTGEAEALSEQLRLLMQERTRIRNILEENEGSFSLFGWASRFINSYEEASIDEIEENKLAEEVGEAINAAAENSANVDSVNYDYTEDVSEEVPSAALGDDENKEEVVSKNTLDESSAESAVDVIDTTPPAAPVN